MLIKILGDRESLEFWIEEVAQSPIFHHNLSYPQETMCMCEGQGDGAGIIEVWEGIEAENTEFHPQRGGKDVTGNC